ncbi:4-hydroxy-tetrahydrodipicolinate synthase [Rhodococcus sp. 15-649-2-2]|nr:4-hydroxy-tetrahydrodipicolinate synthase [Rhodococcus sp. 15-649-2-2]
MECVHIDHEATLRNIADNPSLDRRCWADHTHLVTNSAPSSSSIFGTNVVAMVTPMHPDGTIDRAGVDALLVHLLSTGCDGVVVGGTTGEAPTLTSHELSGLITQAREHSNDAFRVIAGLGTNDTAAGMDMARSAAAAGADALLISAPHYSRPTQAGIVAHIVDIAGAGGLPVMMYDVPARTGIAIEQATLIELSRHPSIRAVKDAKGDLYEAMTVMASTELAYYCGIDELALPYLCCGATGLVSVTGNAVADRYAEMIEAVRTGDLDRANAVQRALLPLTDAVMRTTQGAIMAKAALVRIGVLSDATVRRPLLESSTTDLRRLDAALRATGIDQESRSVGIPVRLA